MTENHDFWITISGDGSSGKPVMSKKITITVE